MFFILQVLFDINLQVVMSLQLNVMLRSEEGLEMMKNLPSLHLPVFWFRSSTALPSWMWTLVWLLSKLTTILISISVLCILSSLASLLFLHRGGDIWIISRIKKIWTNWMN